MSPDLNILKVTLVPSVTKSYKKFLNFPPKVKNFDKNIFLKNRKKRLFLGVNDHLSNLIRGPLVSYLYEVVEGSEPYHMWKKNYSTSGFTFERYCSDWVVKIFDTFFFTFINFLTYRVILRYIWPFSATRGALFDLSMGKESWRQGLSNDTLMTSIGLLLAEIWRHQNRFFRKKKKKRPFFGSNRAFFPQCRTCITRPTQCC